MDYAVTSNSIETHKFIYTPNYTTSPPTNINLVSTWNGINNNDRFNLTHSPSGNTIRLTLYSSTAAVIIPVATAVGSAFTPTAGTDYEFEIVIDSVAGTVRVFIDGVLHGTNSPGSWTRSTTATIATLGASASVYNVGQASFDDYIIYSDAQHTAGYTPGYTLNDTRYLADTISLPAFSYTGLGNIQTFDGITETEANAPHYILNDEYWDGLAWVASDGSYAQSNTAADFNTNLPTATATDAPVIKLATSSSNIQMSVDNLILTYTGQIYPTSDPVMSTVQTLELDEILDFTSSLTETGSDEIRFIANVDGTDMYHNGAAWVASDLSFAQSNTQAEITALLPIIVGFQKVTLRLKTLFHSDDGSTTPTIETMTIEYGFYNAPNDTIALNTVYGHNFDNQGNADTTPFTVKLSRDFVEYKTESIIRSEVITVTPDSAGFWSVQLVETANMEGTVFYEFNIPNKGKILKQVPNEASTAFVDL